MGKKITELPSGATFSDNDYFIIEDSTSTKKVTVSEMKQGLGIDSVNSALGNKLTYGKIEDILHDSENTIMANWDRLSTGIWDLETITIRSLAFVYKVSSNYGSVIIQSYGMSKPSYGTLNNGSWTFIDL